MKVCKKCKNKVANKAKVCPKCGSDVSKAKIIMSTKNNNKAKINNKINSANVAEKKDISEDVAEVKKEINLTDNSKKVEKQKVNKKNKYQKRMENNKKTIHSNKKKTGKQIKKESKKTNEADDKKLKINTKKEIENKKENNVKKEQLTKEKKNKKSKKVKEQKNKIETDKTSKLDSKKTNSVLKKLKEKNDEILIKIAKSKVKKTNKKIEAKIKKHKKALALDLEKQKDKLLSKQNQKKQEIKKEQSIKITKTSDLKTTNKEETQKQELKPKVSLNDLSKNIVNINEKTNIDNENDKSLYNKIFNKKILLFICILTMSVTFVYCGMQISGLVLNNDYTNIDDFNKGKTYEMNNKVSYNGIVYNITKATITEPSTYKKPRDGYEFILVNIDLENKSDSKQTYSYKNFKLKNSKDEETTRIFTPVNAQTALYSGSLVIGAKKSGTLVFEAPIDDNKLTLNFYKDTEDSENNELIYSVNITVSK